jgi:hypothetical protein
MLLAMLAGAIFSTSTGPRIAGQVSTSCNGIAAPSATIIYPAYPDLSSMRQQTFDEKAALEHLNGAKRLSLYPSGVGQKCL